MASPDLVTVQHASDLLNRCYGEGPARVVSVPGRVNLIGEHIDYFSLPVLPMAIPRRTSIAFRPREDGEIRITSAGYGQKTIALAEQRNGALRPGDWVNYLRAAVQMVMLRWSPERGIDAAVSSDLPPAAGLSSSSALLTGFALALLHANGISPTVAELMEVLPEGEHYVGTRGGGMDHAAVLACRLGSALLVHFSPFELCSIPIPEDWAFVVAHSLTTAEKSGALLAEYNARRTAGASALLKLGFSSFCQALDLHSQAELAQLAQPLSGMEQRAFLHVVSEAGRVGNAVDALRAGDIFAFGELLSASHVSLRDQLNVSNAALDELVECALRAGAVGARLTGAGFGGCAIVLCKMADRDRVCSGLSENFFQNRSQFDPAMHLLFAEPSAGALSE